MGWGGVYCHWASRRSSRWTRHTIGMFEPMYIWTALDKFILECFMALCTCLFIIALSIYQAESILYVWNVSPLNIPEIHFFWVMLFDLTPICQIIGLYWIVIICRILKKTTPLQTINWTFVYMESVEYVLKYLVYTLIYYWLRLGLRYVLLKYSLNFLYYWSHFIVQCMIQLFCEYLIIGPAYINIPYWILWFVRKALP